MNLVSMMNILEETKIEDFPRYKEEKYMYNGVPVPRVTDILGQMLHVDGLMQWANSIGFRHQSYNKTLQAAADKGSYVHDFIEHYIKEGIEPDFTTVPNNIVYEVRTAFQSFLAWWEIISKTEYEVLMQEQPLVSPWFGGTLDLLIKINGRIFLMDFKTSNHSSFKYFLQMSAYRYMLKQLYDIDVDGCGILMFSKKEVSFQEIIVDFQVAEDVAFMTQCQETFFSIVYGYLNRMQTELMFKDVLKRNKEREKCINE